MKFQSLATVALLTLAFPAFAGDVVKTPLGAPPAVPMSTAAEPEATDQIRLNPSITVTGDVIRLGDVFSGFLVRPEKVVANAPRPGQRLVLSAEWLTTLARTYGLDWHPASVYDRAIAYQPGQTIGQAEILAAVRTALTAKGLPANFELTVTRPVETVTVALNAAADVGVREAFYDPNAKAFTAVVEIPAGDPKASFVPLRGVAFGTVAVPVLKENAGKAKTITAEMIDIINVREELVKAATIVDPGVLIGKSPKFFVKAGLPVQETDVALIRLVEVPVLSVDTSRDAKITADQIVMTSFNAADLPPDAVLDASQLVGKTPRRLLAAGSPIRRNDVQIVRHVQVPVAARDLARGEMLEESDLTMIAVVETEMVSNVLTDIGEIVGRSTKHAMRTGQMMHAFDIARPVAVERGKMVTILYDVPLINLTAQGIAQEKGGVGDVIRVTNSKSNTVVTAEVIDAHTVRISSAHIGPKQTASSN